MNKEEFRTFLSQLEYREGQIFHGQRRLIINGADWLAGLQVEMENVIGEDGAFAIVDTLALRGSRQMGEMYAERLKQLPLRQQLEAVLKMAPTFGWGVCSITEFNESPLSFKIRYDHSYVTGVMKDHSSPKCYFLSTLTAILKALLEKSGATTGEMDYEETHCVAKGDPHCLFSFSEKTS